MAGNEGRELRRTLVPSREADGGYESGSRSGALSCVAGGRTESPTAMMRIAKIADEDGGTDAGAGLAAGDSLCERGGSVTGWGGTETPLGGVSRGGNPTSANATRNGSD
jgi:hypothetical protein